MLAQREQLTLYSAKICAFSHRVELALQEVHADYTTYYVGSEEQPEWYASKINPTNTVPALTYGGPRVPPDQPSPEAIRLTGSLMLLEFIADLYPESKLMPEDPVLRARTRLFIETVDTDFLPALYAYVRDGEDPNVLLDAIRAIQTLLPDPGDGQYAIGEEYTIADVAIAPFLARLEICLKHDLGSYAEGEGPKVYELLGGIEFRKFVTYAYAIMDRDSFVATFDEEYVTKIFLEKLQAMGAPVECRRRSSSRFIQNESQHLI